MSGGVWYFDISWYYQTVMVISKYQKDYQESEAFYSETISGWVWYFVLSIRLESGRADTKLINTSFVEQNIYCLKKTFTCNMVLQNKVIDDEF